MASLWRSQIIITSQDPPGTLRTRRRPYAPALPPLDTALANSAAHFTIKDKKPTQFASIPFDIVNEQRSTTTVTEPLPFTSQIQTPRGSPPLTPRKTKPMSPRAGVVFKENIRRAVPPKPRNHQSKRPSEEKKLLTTVTMSRPALPSEQEKPLTTFDRVLLALQNRQKISPTMEPLMPSNNSVNNTGDGHNRPIPAGPSPPSERPVFESNGPHAYSESKFGAECEDFIDFVSDDEGDPRENRITPEEFLKAVTGFTPSEAGRKPKDVARGIHMFMQSATGMVSAGGDHHAEQGEPSGSVAHPQVEKEELPKKHTLERQFDVNTGEELSPSYSQDTFPRPLMAPQAVDMSRLPGNFAKSYPEPFNHWLNSAAKSEDIPGVTKEHSNDNIFGGGEAAEVPDHGEKFTERGIIEAFENSEDPEQKLETFVRIIDCLDQAEKKRASVHATHEIYLAHYKNLSTTNDQLRREISRIKAQQNAVHEASRARHLQQLQSRYSQMKQDIAHTEASTREIRKENHKMAAENAELLKEYQELTLKLEESEE